MDYRYKVKGCVESAFILRGMHFRVGVEINTLILESELAFVKEHCKLYEVNDFASTSKPIPNNLKISPKGVKNELPKSTSGGNKVKNKATV